MPEEPCIRIHCEKEDGSLMRPKTPTPDKHWTGMIAGPYLDNPSIQITYPQDRSGPEIHICKNFWRECDYGFDHLMRFVKSNGLTVTIDRGQCGECEGRESCVSNRQEDER